MSELRPGFLRRVAPQKARVEAPSPNEGADESSKSAVAVAVKEVAAAQSEKRPPPSLCRSGEMPPLSLT